MYVNPIPLFPPPPLHSTMYVNPIPLFPPPPLHSTSKVFFTMTLFVQPPPPPKKKTSVRLSVVYSSCVSPPPPPPPPRRKTWIGLILLCGQRAQVFDSFTGQQRGKLRGHFDSVNCCVWNPLDEELLTGSSDGNILVWKAPEEAVTLESSGDVSTATQPEARV